MKRNVSWFTYNVFADIHLSESDINDIAERIVLLCIEDSERKSLKES